MVAAAAPKATPQPSVAEAFAAPAPAATPAPARTAAVRFVSNPVVQKLPARSETSAPRIAAASQRRMAATAAPAPVASDKAANTHLVQLGAYDSKIEAERGWTVLKRKFPQLKDHDVVITEAVVDGRTFWRVAASGFGPKSARSMCGTVKSSGRGCFAYAKTNPPACVVDRGVRMAANTRR